jgi:lycopene cyclase domain-containing protein
MVSSSMPLPTVVLASPYYGIDRPSGLVSRPTVAGAAKMTSMDRYQYLVLLGLCVVVTLPLELVIGVRVWRRPRRLLRALAVPVAVFCIEDVAAIARHHWRYSARYTTGWRLPGRLPVEELAFFIVIPICALLTLEAVRRLLGED